MATGISLINTTIIFIIICIPLLIIIGCIVKKTKINKYITNILIVFTQLIMFFGIVILKSTSDFVILFCYYIIVFVNFIGVELVIISSRKRIN
ncbi:MAG: hypothetical protein N4A63_14875 [Vallitalea sp.]|jgi:hypothetical protein|nr:hypothetical protein [Vallitalea sp.]